MNGHAKIGEDGSATCAAASDGGRLRYDSTTGNMQYCDGVATAWTNMGGSSGEKAPVGSIVAWHKSLTGTPALPDGWVECNGQVLSDSDSPYDGLTMPNLNSDTQNGSTSSGMFLRGASTSGTLQADATAKNGLWASTNAEYVGGGSYSYAAGIYYMSPATVTLSSTDIETRPANMTVVWIMRVK